MSCNVHRDQIVDAVNAASAKAAEFVGLGIPEVRRRVVTEFAEHVYTAELDAGDAVLILDALGLTGDREILADALAAKSMADGLRAGVYDPRHIDPHLLVPRGEAVEILAVSYDEQYAEAVAKLALPRTAPDPLAAVSA